MLNIKYISQKSFEPMNFDSSRWTLGMQPQAFIFFIYEQMFVYLSKKLGLLKYTKNIRL